MRRAKLPRMPVPRVPPRLLPPVLMPERQPLRAATVLRPLPRPRSPITVRVGQPRRIFSAARTRSTRPLLKRHPLDWERATPLAGYLRASGHWLRQLPSKMLLPIQLVRILFYLVLSSPCHCQLVKKKKDWNLQLCLPLSRECHPITLDNIHQNSWPCELIIAGSSIPNQSDEMKRDNVSIESLCLALL